MSAPVFGEVLYGWDAPKWVSYYCGSCSQPVSIADAAFDAGCPYCGAGGTEADLTERIERELWHIAEHEDEIDKANERLSVYRATLAKVRGVPS